MAHKIIEIIGPPGVGKSTLYKALCKTWSADSNWIYQDALLTPAKPSILDFGNWLEYHAKKLLGKKLTKNIKTEFGLRFVDSNPALANFYWSHLSDTRTYSSNEIDKRFRSAYILFYDFCRYQAILESIYEKPCLINEGLLQKSFFVHEDEEFLHALLNTYLSLLPLPYAVIFINTTSNSTILERLCNRKKIIASHVGKDESEIMIDIEKWQRTLSLIIDKTEDSSVKILRIDGEKPIDDNVRHIKEMLANL